VAGEKGEEDNGEERAKGKGRWLSIVSFLLRDFIRSLARPFHYHAGMTRNRKLVSAAACVRLSVVLESGGSPSRMAGGRKVRTP
jgi:hypothetical protein